MKKRAFTLVELLVVVAIIALLVGLLLPALAKAQATAKTVKDSNQIKQIHTAMVSRANETKGGKLPTPGLINRRAYGGQQLPGEGEEDFAKNRTPCLYAACVAQQLFNTDILVGPTEVNPVVKVYGTYNYNAYNPAADTYWDGDVGNGGTIPASIVTGFKSKIDAQAGSANPADECHTSYAHLMLIGLRKTQHWRNHLDSGRPHLSTRGCRNGAVTGNDYTFSPTLRLHASPKSWEGNVCFADTHMEFSETFRPDGVMYECGNFNNGNLTKDNLFACGGTQPAEFGGQGCVDVGGATGTPQPWAGGDTMLAIHYGATNSTGTTAIPNWDALEGP
jgi:prepilin-type N-terminal cleavage/methylation domain-containing protein